MMTYFKKTCELTEEDKKQVSEMVGQMQLWVLEGRHIYDIADRFKLEPWEVMENVFETIYGFMKLIGPKNYLKMWFHKRCWKRNKRRGL